MFHIKTDKYRKTVCTYYVFGQKKKKNTIRLKRVKRSKSLKAIRRIKTRAIPIILSLPVGANRNVVRGKRYKWRRKKNDKKETKTKKVTIPMHR